MRLIALLSFAALTSAAVSTAQVRGVAVENIDRSVSACNDFDRFANGQWRATHPMPAIHHLGYPHHHAR